MNTPYEPSPSIKAKVLRKLLPFRARNDLHFSLRRPVVSFTFDDFPRSAITHGSDILETHNWRGTFYVASGLKGTENHHGQHFLGEDICALHARGHEIAGHSFSHTDCDQLGVTNTLDEINHNKVELEKMGYFAPIDHFAYPFGAANANLKQALQSQFKTVRGITPKVHHDKVDLNNLYSAPIFSGEKMVHTLGLIHGLQTKPGWLTLFAHDIRNQPSHWGCTPAEFITVVNAVKESGAIVLPIGEALQYLQSHPNT